MPIEHVIFVPKFIRRVKRHTIKCRKKERMKNRKEKKSLIVFLAISIMLINSLPANAAKLGFNSGRIEASETIEIDSENLMMADEVAHPNACAHQFKFESCDKPLRCSKCGMTRPPVGHSFKDEGNTIRCTRCGRTFNK